MSHASCLQVLRMILCEMCKLLMIHLSSFSCRHVAEVDASLEKEMDREILRMRQREKASKSKQTQQFRNFFDRDP